MCPVLNPGYASFAEAVERALFRNRAHNQKVWHVVAVRDPVTGKPFKDDRGRFVWAALPTFTFVTR